MSIKNLGKSAAKFDALGSLARTDDMLAVIGIIMLVWVIVSSYGAFWQGRLASAQYKEEFNGTSISQVKDRTKSIGYTVLMFTISALILGLIIYIFRNSIKSAVTEK